MCFDFWASDIQCLGRKTRPRVPRVLPLVFGTWSLAVELTPPIFPHAATGNLRHLISERRRGREWVYSCRGATAKLGSLKPVVSHGRAGHVNPFRAVPARTLCDRNCRAWVRRANLHTYLFLVPLCLTHSHLLALFLYLKQNVVDKIQEVPKINKLTQRKRFKV